MKSDELYGLILVGGKSSRMGQDKAHLVMDKQPQWQRCLELLEPFCGLVYFSTSKKLLTPLPDSLMLIPDIFLEPIGPLGGIISAFKRYPDKSFFVLACDMPNFNEEAVRFLLEHRNRRKKATLYVKKGHAEPLCGIYEPGIFSDLLIAFGQGLACPRKIVEELDIERVVAKNEPWLTNINHAHELAQLSSGLKEQKEVTVYFYATLREQAGKSKEMLRTDAKSVGQLFLELKHRYSFLLEEEFLRFAKNNQLVSAVCELEDQDEVVFIPRSRVVEVEHEKYFGATRHVAMLECDGCQ